MKARGYTKMASHDSTEKRSSGWSWIVGSVSGIVFAGFFVYLWLYIQPHVIYNAFGRHINFPIFQTGWSFFWECLSFPGGAVNYVGRFLSQYYYFSWLGAVIITVVAWGICRLTRIILAMGGPVRLSALCYFPTVLIAVMYSRYDHPLATCLALLLGLLFVVVYQERLSKLSGPVRGLLFVLGFVLLYYVAAGGAVFFGVMVAVYELVVRRRVFMAGLAVVVAGVVPLLAAEFFLALEVPDAYGRFLIFDLCIFPRTRPLVVALCLFFPVAVALLGVWRIIFKSKTVSRKLKFTETTKIGSFFSGGTVQWAARTIVLLGIGVAGVFFSIDNNRRTLLRMTYLSSNGMWGKIIRQAIESPSILSNVYLNNDINLALYHTGQLGSSLFGVRQQLDALVLRDQEPRDALRCLKICDMLLELGHINEAQQQMNDLMERLGECPFIIKQLALTHIVKGQTYTSRVFLNRLSRDLKYGPYARGLLARLDRDPTLYTDPYVKHLRANMLVEDSVKTGGSTEKLLTNSLQRNPRNRMAFEYLMAYYLLTGQHDDVAANIHRLDDFAYTAIPRHYEEALLLYMTKPGAKVDLGSRQINAATKEAFKRFNAMFMQFRGDRRTAWINLAPHFRNTYFFYFVFQSPAAASFWPASGVPK